MESRLRINPATTAPFLLVLPVVSAVASYSGSRTYLLALFLFIAALAFTPSLIDGISSSDKDRTFLVLIISVSLSLLASATFASPRLLGYDIHGEYLVFQEVLKSNRWQPEVDVPYNSVLSVTILPAVISLVTGMNGIQVFKFVYPALFSIVPITLYKLFRTIIKPEAAFLSVLLFMAYPTFYITLVTIARQEIAEILFALALLVLVNKGRVHGSASIILLLSAGIAFSHYSVAYLYIAMLTLSYVPSLLTRNKGIRLADLTSILTSCLIVVTWYTYVTGGGEITKLSLLMYTVGTGLVSVFFNPLSRPAIFLQALGVQSNPGILYDINRLTDYLVLLLLIAGVILLLREKKKDVAKTRMLILAVFGFVFIMTAAVLPFFAFAFEVSRIINLSLMLISPCLVYGLTWKKFQSAIQANRPLRLRLSNRTMYLAMGTIMFSFFLFNSGWVSAVSNSGTPSVLLDNQRMLESHQPVLESMVLNYYVPAADAAGAQWLAGHHSPSSFMCADYSAPMVLLMEQFEPLTPYGEFPGPSAKLPFGCDYSRSYVFLRELNTVYGVGSGWNNSVWAMSTIYPVIRVMDVVYSNGGATIYAPYTRTNSSY